MAPRRFHRRLPTMCTPAAPKALALRTTEPMLKSLPQFSMATWNGWRVASSSATIASIRQYRNRSITLRRSPSASSSGSKRSSSGQCASPPGQGPTPTCSSVASRSTVPVSRMRLRPRRAGPRRNLLFTGGSTPRLSRGTPVCHRLEVGVVPVTERRGDEMAEPIANWLTDMDGVLVHEEDALPGAAEFVARLREKEIPFQILTNNSIYTPRDLAARLRDSGIDVEEETIWTSALATASFLAHQVPGGSAYVIGEAGLTTSLYQYGYILSSTSPDYVVLGETRTYSFSAITRAIRLINDG